MNSHLRTIIMQDRSPFEMVMHLVAAVVVTISVPMAMAPAAGQRPPLRKPPPEGVVELVGVGGSGSSLVELKDGSLMLLLKSSYRISTDGGLSWGKAKSLGKGISGNGIIRLRSASGLLSTPISDTMDTAPTRSFSFLWLATPTTKGKRGMLARRMVVALPGSRGMMLGPPAS